MKRRGRVRERILRILLNAPDDALTMYRVAKKAKCSFSWGHEFLGKLEAMGLADRTEVRDYAALIGYWREVKTKPDACMQNPLTTRNTQFPS